jgi:hypothetical protein
MFRDYEFWCIWEEGATAILSYYIDILLVTQKKSTKILIWYNDVSDQVRNPDSMKEIQTHDCFTKLHLAVGGTVQSAWNWKREV